MCADYGDEKEIKKSEVGVHTTLARELLILKSQNRMAHILLADECTENNSVAKASWH